MGHISVVFEQMNKKETGKVVIITEIRLLSYLTIKLRKSLFGNFPSHSKKGLENRSKFNRTQQRNTYFLRPSLPSLIKRIFLFSI